MTHESIGRGSGSSLRPSAVWLAEDCPIGCGELVVLRALPSKALFRYCTACGCGFPDLVSSECIDPALLAPGGIEFPSREAVESELRLERILEAPFDDGAFWDLIANTHLARGEPRAALAIVEHVIATWYRPPERALDLRARALAAMRVER